MRAMFGLVGLLVTVAVVMWIFSKTSIPTAKEGLKAQDQARQISGRGEDGVSAVDSFKIEPEFRGSELQGLNVTSVTPGGALASYGLQKGDRILEINGNKVAVVSNNDPETAKALVHDAFRGSQPIIVLRNGVQVTLPPGTSPGSPGAGSVQSPSSLQKQLNNITGAGSNQAQ